MFIHKAGEPLYGIHVCIKTIEQDALCCRGQSWKRSWADLLWVLHMSVDIKWNHNFLKNYICKALTHPLFHLTFLRFTQVKVVLFFVIYPCFYHQVLSLSVLSLSSTCHCLQNTSWAHPLCISINTTSVKGSITAHLDYRISLLTGLFQFELMKPIFYMKARVMLLEYKLYHSTPLFKLVSGFCTELRIKPVFLIKV